MTTIRPRLLLSALATVLTLLTPGLASAGFRSGFDTNTLAANDDLSTGANALGFTANFFGTNYTTAFVNNNGNLTFTGPLGTFTPFGLTTNTATPIIAPFFADVDTRPAASGKTKYGTGTVDGFNAFGATWGGVAGFGVSTSLLDSFQVVLSDRSDTGAGNFDIEFNYTSIQWDTGSASGGQSARAGFSAGTGAPGSFFELTGSGVNNAFKNGGPNSLPANSLNSEIAGRYLFNVRSGEVVPPVVVPVPAGLMIGLLGGAGLFGFRRTRRA